MRVGWALPASATCARTRRLKLASYDRLFPHQDTMPKGGFGNLIAPCRCRGRRGVFVDSDLRPHPDQWEFLASIQPMSPQDIEPSIARPRAACIPST
jgi:hypothetical protein